MKIQPIFEAPVKRPRPKEGEVKRSRAVLGCGQAVKALIWAVKDLDLGRSRILTLVGNAWECPPPPPLMLMQLPSPAPRIYRGE